MHGRNHFATNCPRTMFDEADEGPVTSDDDEDGIHKQVEFKEEVTSHDDLYTIIRWSSRKKSLRNELSSLWQMERVPGTMFDEALASWSKKHRHRRSPW